MLHEPINAKVQIGPRPGIAAQLGSALRIGHEVLDGPCESRRIPGWDYRRGGTCDNVVPAAVGVCRDDGGSCREGIDEDQGASRKMGVLQRDNDDRGTQRQRSTVVGCNQRKDGHPIRQGRSNTVGYGVGNADHGGDRGDPQGRDEGVPVAMGLPAGVDEGGGQRKRKWISKVGCAARRGKVDE